MHDLIAFIGDNAELVITHPAAFATFAVLFGGGGFAVGRIANLESRIARRDDEIVALKAKQTGQEREASMIPIIGTSEFLPSEPVTSRQPVAQRRESLHVR
jgi:hypothetical protein